MPDTSGGRSAAPHLRPLAQGPRFAGSEGERAAAAYCRDVLEAHGFSVSEEPFAFSPVVGRWLVPLTGALTASALLGTALAWSRSGPTRSTGIALLGLAALLAGVGTLGARRGVLGWPSQRTTARNLVAARGRPRVWLVAHLDTKSQPFSSLVRAAALVVAAAALAASGVAGAARAAGGAGWMLLPLVGALAATVVAFAVVGNASPGAADNASGVACVLGVASRLEPGVSLGVLLTSGEELGLAGARAWAARRPPGIAINVDTVDDTGRTRCMRHGRASRRLSRDLAAFATGRGVSLAVTPLLPGVLTDGVALAGAGWEVVTLSRGTLATLGRIHRPGDTVEKLDGSGAESLAGLVADYLRARS